MKFHITDENGESCTVEEIIEAKTEDEENAENETPLQLSQDEISELKALLPKLKALVETKDAEEKADEEEDITDSDIEEEIAEDNDEEIVDTDEDEDEDDKESMHDSINSISNCRTSANDAIDTQSEIASAWAKRFNGGNR